MPLGTARLFPEPDVGAGKARINSRHLLPDTAVTSVPGMGAWRFSLNCVCPVYIQLKFGGEEKQQYCWNYASCIIVVSCSVHDGHSSRKKIFHLFGVVLGTCIATLSSKYNCVNSSIFHQIHLSPMGGGCHKYINY